MSPKAREHRFRRLKELGCLACWKDGRPDVYPEIQHLNLGGHAGQKQLGDEFTIPLCRWHHQKHRMDPSRDAAWHEELLGPSLKDAAKFHEKYGTDDELLAKTNDLIRMRDEIAFGWKQAPVTEAQRVDSLE